MERRLDGDEESAKQLAKFEGPLASGAGSSWFLSVHNLLDKEYRVHGSGLDGPGLGLVFGARWGR